MFELRHLSVALLWFLCVTAGLALKACVVGGSCRSERDCSQTEVCQRGLCQRLVGALKLDVTLPYAKPTEVVKVVATLESERLKQPIQKTLGSDGNAWKLSLSKLPASAPWRVAVVGYSGQQHITYTKTLKALEIPNGKTLSLSLSLERKAKAHVWTIPSSVSSTVTDMTRDGEGNLYVVGTFENDLTVGSFSFSAQGQTDIYVASFSPQGDLRWARHFGDFSVDRVNRVQVDAKGYCYIAGEMRSWKVSMGAFTFVNGGTNHFNPYLMKLDSFGKVVWLRSGFSTSNAHGSALAVDGSGHIYLGGASAGHITFGEHKLTFPKGGKKHSYIASYTSDGSFRWARTLGADHQSQSHIRALTIDKSGALVLVGSFSGIWSDTGTPAPLTSRGGEDVIVAKLSSKGEVEWARQAGGEGPIADVGFAVFGSPTEPAIYVCGESAGPASFGEYSLLQSDQARAFLAKLSKNGTWLWARALESPSNGRCNAIVADQQHVFATGLFHVSASMGGFSIESSIQNTWVAKLNLEGEPTKLKQPIGSLSGHGKALVLFPTGDVWLAGSIRGKGTVDGVPLVTNAKQSNGLMWKLALP